MNFECGDLIGSTRWRVADDVSGVLASIRTLSEKQATLLASRRERHYKLASTMPKHLHQITKRSPFFLFPAVDYLPRPALGECKRTTEAEARSVAD
ncbi:hypothetical protein [Nostoc sp.]|uniref:hypothetical protein n=1 Tax=Nostoc sp. TaxID=1180 RepID=UPI002FF42A2C